MPVADDPRAKAADLPANDGLADVASSNAVVTCVTISSAFGCWPSALPVVSVWSCQVVAPGATAPDWATVGAMVSSLS